MNTPTLNKVLAMPDAHFNGEMDYYLTPFSGDNYLSGKDLSSPHASPVVCQHHTLQQDLAKSPGVGVEGDSL